MGIDKISDEDLAVAMMAAQEGENVDSWFAGMALSGMLANPRNKREVTIGEMGLDAYNFADAMLAAREQEE